MKRKKRVVIIVAIFSILIILLILLFSNRNYDRKTFKDKVNAGETTSILIVGDSIGGGMEETDWCMLVANQLKEEGIDVNVDNVSLGGNTVFAGYSQLAEYEKNVDIIIFCFGQNDADNEDFPIIYENMIRLAKKKYPYAEEIAILESSQKGYTNKINKIINLCNYYDIPYVDMIEEFNDSIISYDNLTSDGVHPNDEGKQIYAQAIMDVINNQFLKKNSPFFFFNLEKKDVLPDPIHEITSKATHYKYISKDMMRASNLTLSVNIDEAYSFVGADAMFISGEHEIVGQMSDGVKFYVSYTWDYEPQHHIYKGSNSEIIQGNITLTFDSQDTLDNFYGLILCN